MWLVRRKYSEKQLALKVVRRAQFKSERHYLRELEGIRALERAGKIEGVAPKYFTCHSTHTASTTRKSWQTPSPPGIELRLETTSP